MADSSDLSAGLLGGLAGAAGFGAVGLAGPLGFAIGGIAALLGNKAKKDEQNRQIEAHNKKIKSQRKLVTSVFANKGIECRPIVAGNFMKNPVIKYLDYIDNDDYKNADYIHENGLFVGNDVTDLSENIKYLDEMLTLVKELLI